MQLALVLASAVTLALPAAAQCEDYSKYSTKPQGTPSAGPLGLPFMRPPAQCRTFNSSAVENVITQMKARLKDPDVARLFENTFPNTLDTTVKYFSKEKNLAFIITGDITAQWLRDTANQLAHYHTLLGKDRELATLVKAARYISEYPYCGAFQPPPESGLHPTVNDWATGVTVNPYETFSWHVEHRELIYCVRRPVNNQTVFECKYELDSLCGFLKLSRSYFQATKDSSFANDNWNAAISQIFRVMEEQSQGTFDKDFNVVSYYNWTGGNGALPPMELIIGRVDDLSVYAYLTPANAMLSVELVHLADILDSMGRSKEVSKNARKWSSQIKNAIWNYTVADGVFAYETNGLGSRYLMDDANVPSLLSLPYLGFLNRSDSTYKKTKKTILSRLNPYYAEGKTFFGTGGPHVDTVHPWPMSLISAIYGSDDDKEIEKLLYTIVNNTAGLGLIHESQSVHKASDYTRPWFAWANSYFAEMLLDLAQRKPKLIFKSPEPYIIG
ncbi:hypothetical protein FRC09_005132 [Ceratobasidium sp. 395]|nr:hypothetical protein FRC09_005132 [Ceratobasidium sp. 395]